MLSGESISKVDKCLTHILNHPMVLGKTFKKECLNIKVLKVSIELCNSKSQLYHNQRMTSMNVATIFGKLREHGLELGRLKEDEEIDQKRKGLALKPTTSNHGESEEEKLKKIKKWKSKFTCRKVPHVHKEEN